MTLVVLCSLPGNVRYKFSPSSRHGLDFVTLSKFRPIYGDTRHNIFSRILYGGAKQYTEENEML